MKVIESGDSERICIYSSVDSKIKIGFFARYLSQYARIAFILCVTVALSGCSNWLPIAGPSSVRMIQSAHNHNSILPVVDITPIVTQRLALSHQAESFAEYFSENTISAHLVNPGDVLEVSIWEASPALLFSIAPATLAAGTGAGGRSSTLPEQVIGTDGFITVPFAGRIKVSGKTLQRIEADIVKALEGKANYPQVIVRMTRNTTSNVTVVGEVHQSVLSPLTPRGERLLDVIAAAGGVKQPINKITLQLSRGSIVRKIALEKVIRNPQENIRLHPGDVITAYYQPLTFTAFGATGKNEEISFEAQGITLAQALARVGGLQDGRADASGVYVFRFENSGIAMENVKTDKQVVEKKNPIVYRLNMSEPNSFFLAQKFQIRDQDIIYVSNATSVELQKFLNILVSIVYPLVNVGNIMSGN